MKNLYFLFFLLNFIPLFSQPATDLKRDYQWIVGNEKDNDTGEYKGLLFDFNGDSLAVSTVSKAFYNQRANASICDSEGNLLMYTNCCMIADGNHNVPMGGDILNTCKSYQNIGRYFNNISLLLPLNNLFYLFTQGQKYSLDNGYSDRFYLNVIEKMDNSIRIVKKDSVLLDGTYSLKRSHLGACRHGNGIDWWIVTTVIGDNRYIKFLLTDDKLLGPFIQNVDAPHADSDRGNGALIFSSDGNKLIDYGSGSDMKIFDFDRCTGEISNPIHIRIEDASDIFHVGGMAISQSGQYLYVPSMVYLYQFDLWVEDIGESKTIVAEYDNYRASGSTLFYEALLAPDGKIYVTYPSYEGSTIHVVESPDSAGLACNVVQHKYYFPVKFSGGLPNFPNFRLGALEGSPCDTITVIDEPNIIDDVYVAIHPNPATNKIKITTSKEIISWNIVDISGISVREGKNIYEEKDIIVNDLSNGIYFFNALFDKGITKAIKLIIIQ